MRQVEEGAGMEGGRSCENASCNGYGGYGRSAIAAVVSSLPLCSTSSFPESHVASWQWAGEETLT